MSLGQPYTHVRAMIATFLPSWRISNPPPRLSPSPRHADPSGRRNRAERRRWWPRPAPRTDRPGDTETVESVRADVPVGVDQAANEVPGVLADDLPLPVVEDDVPGVLLARTVLGGQAWPVLALAADAGAALALDVADLVGRHDRGHGITACSGCLVIRENDSRGTNPPRDQNAR